MNIKKSPLRQVNLHLSKNSKNKDENKITAGGFSELQKREGNIGAGGALKFNYPKGSTQFGIGGFKPITKDPYSDFKGAGGLNVEQSFKLGDKWKGSIKGGLNKGIGKNFDLKDFQFGVSFTKKF